MTHGGYVMAHGQTLALASTVRRWQRVRVTHEELLNYFTPRSRSSTAQKISGLSTNCRCGSLEADLLTPPSVCNLSALEREAGYILRTVIDTSPRDIKPRRLAELSTERLWWLVLWTLEHSQPEYRALGLRVPLRNH